MTPKDADRKENENKVWRNIYPEFGGKTLIPKLSIGDNVRITKKIKYLITVTLKDGLMRFFKFQEFN